MTFAEELRNLLKAANLPAVPIENGERQARWVQLVDEFFNLKKASKARAPKGTPRPRNPLFDTLAHETGSDPHMLTRAAAKAVAVSLADILAVCPTLTAEEITRRAAAYKRRWPDRRNWSAPALAKHWATFGGGDPTRAAKNDVYQEPKEWLTAARKLYGADVAEQMKAKGWLELGTDLRRAILEENARGAAA